MPTLPAGSEMDNVEAMPGITAMIENENAIVSIIENSRRNSLLYPSSASRTSSATMVPSFSSAMEIASLAALT